MKTTTSFSLLIILLSVAGRSLALTSDSLSGKHTVFGDPKASDSEIAKLFQDYVEEITDEKKDFNGLPKSIADLATFDLGLYAQSPIADQEEFVKQVTKLFEAHRENIFKQDYEELMKSASALAKMHMVGNMIKNGDMTYRFDDTQVKKLLEKVSQTVKETIGQKSVTEKKMVFSPKEQGAILSLYRDHYNSLEDQHNVQASIFSDIQTTIVPEILRQLMEVNDQETVNSILQRIEDLVRVLDNDERIYSIYAASIDNSEFSEALKTNGLLKESFSRAINTIIIPTSDEKSKIDLLRSMLQNHFNQYLVVDGESSATIPDKINMCDVILEDLNSNGWMFDENQNEDELSGQIRISSILYCTLVNYDYSMNNKNIEQLASNYYKIFAIEPVIFKHLRNLPKIFNIGNLDFQNNKQFSEQLIKILTLAIKNNLETDSEKEITTDADMLEVLEGAVESYDALAPENTPIDLANYYVASKLVLMLGDFPEEFDLEFTSTESSAFDDFFSNFETFYTDLNIAEFKKFITNLLTKINPHGSVEDSIATLRNSSIPRDVISGLLEDDSNKA